MEEVNAFYNYGMTSVLAWGAELLGLWLPTLLVLFTTLLVFSVLGRRPKNFPPGMMILPLVGSLLSMPFGPNMAMMRAMKKKYGDMASFAIFDTRIVVVSGVSLIKKVFATDSTTDRPDIIFTTVRNRILTDNRMSEIGLIGTSGQVWQEQRRFLVHLMHDLGFKKRTFESRIMEEITEMMNHLEKKEGRPIEMKRLFHRPVINVLWAIVMGKRYPYDHVKVNKVLEAFMQLSDFNDLSPLSHIPYKLLPYLPSYRHTINGFKDISSFIKDEIKEFLADQELRNGDNFTSIYLKKIEKKENPNFNMDHLMALMFDLFFAGMETTSSTLTTAVHLMAKHQHVQRRVQEELDQVLGRDSLPSFSDRKRLPYVHATISEVMRVFKLVKFPLALKTSRDCKLGGYDLPKGTWVMKNLDDALTNSEYWKNAQEFDPQNFLDENGEYKKNEAFMPFGAGRRICVGQSLAEMELFLFFSHLFQRFTFTLGKEFKPIIETNPMFNATPEYTAIIKCRHNKQ